jgi:hypothetical protein
MSPSSRLAGASSCCSSRLRTASMDTSSSLTRILLRTPCALLGSPLTSSGSVAKRTTDCVLVVGTECLASPWHTGARERVAHRRQAGCRRQIGTGGGHMRLQIGRYYRQILTITGGQAERQADRRTGREADRRTNWPVAAGASLRTPSNSANLNHSCWGNRLRLEEEGGPHGRSVGRVLRTVALQVKVQRRGRRTPRLWPSSREPVGSGAAQRARDVAGTCGGRGRAEVTGRWKQAGEGGRAGVRACGRARGAPAYTVARPTANAVARGGGAATTPG